MGSNDADTLHKIVHDPLAFPKMDDGEECLRDLIQGLLCKQPTQRYGYEQLRAHPWFQSINWDTIVVSEAPAFNRDLGCLAAETHSDSDNIDGDNVFAEF